MIIQIKQKLKNQHNKFHKKYDDNFKKLINNEKIKILFRYNISEIK